jgi:multiple sugar transport system permease protein
MYQLGIEQGQPDVAAAIGVILVIGVLIISLINRRLVGGGD